MMQRMIVDVEEAVPTAGWKSGDAEICQTWEEGSAVKLVRANGGDIDIFPAMGILGVPVPGTDKMLLIPGVTKH